MSIDVDRSDEETLVVRFRLEDVGRFGVVSVVGSFNDWTPGAHELTPDEDGVGTAHVVVPSGHDIHFRYLASDGTWFDEPDADDVTDNGSVIHAHVPTQPGDQHGDRPDATVSLSDGEPTPHSLGAPDPSRGGPTIEAAVANAETGSQVEGVHTPSGHAEPGGSRLEQMRDVSATPDERRVDSETGDAADVPEANPSPPATV